MSSVFMPSHTPKGKHPIDELDGEPAEIIARGAQITTLGRQMTHAWTTISRLVDDGAEMEGDAVSKLREVAGEVGSDLGAGGELYSAVGPHIKTYGEAVEGSKPALNGLVESLESKWSAYHQAETEAASKALWLGDEPADDAEQSVKDSYTQRADEAESAGEDAARLKREWDSLADDYDREWNSWHTAYETAVREIKAGMTGKIEDSWKDDLKGFLNGMIDILTVAGIILAVLAVVIGGPIIMALAAAVAVLTLLAQIAKFTLGDGDGLGLAFAIVGCIPFIGPAARFLKGGGVLAQFGDDFMRFGGKGIVGLAGKGPGAKALDLTTGLLTGKGTQGWAGFMARGEQIFNAGSKTQGFLWAADTFGTVAGTQMTIVSNTYSVATGTVDRFFNPQQNIFSDVDSGDLTKWRDSVFG